MSSLESASAITQLQAQPLVCQSATSVSQTQANPMANTPVSADMSAMFNPSGEHWQERMAYIVDTMREMSRIEEPQEMVRYYASRVRPSLAYNAMVAVSRRGMSNGEYRITRSSRFTEEINPWNSPEKLPVLKGGLLGELLYGDQPRLIEDLRVDPTDPAAFFLSGMRSAIAIPQYDGGTALNMVVQMWDRPGAIDPRRMPEIVWLANLFGRATSNLVLNRRLNEAYNAIDRELKTVGDIQRSLLPMDLPDTPGLEWATHYQTSKNAGGDYYDFFNLPGGCLGILIADVSGHGTPAAVVMAVLHALAHQLPDSSQPSAVLSHLNRELTRRYTSNGMFATAFYAVYEPKGRKLTFSSAGHNPPRLRVGFAGDGGPILSLEQAQGLPLGVMDDAEYPEYTVTLDPGDAVVFYTDGITEAFNATHEQFGTDRLDEIIGKSHKSAASFLGAVLRGVQEFAGGVPPADDRTLLIATAT